jgi:hypothetical protein
MTVYENSSYTILHSTNGCQTEKKNCFCPVVDFFSGKCFSRLTIIKTGGILSVHHTCMGMPPKKQTDTGNLPGKNQIKRRDCQNY